MDGCSKINVQMLQKFVQFILGQHGLPHSECSKPHQIAAATAKNKAHLLRQLRAPKTRKQRRENEIE